MDRIDCQCIAEYLTRIVSSTESKTKDIFIRIPYTFSKLCLLTQLYNCSCICPNNTLSLMEEYSMCILLESNSWGKHSFRNGVNCFIVSLLLLAFFGVFSGFGSVVKWFIIMLIELVIQGTNPTEGRHNSAKTLILMFRRMQRVKIHCMVATLSRQVYISLHLTVNHWLNISLVCMSPQN
jgi:hypothetical protein